MTNSSISHQSFRYKEHGQKWALLVGSDPISLRLVAPMLKSSSIKWLVIGDDSVSLTKILKLIAKRRVTLLWVINQWIARKRQQTYLAKSTAPILPDCLVKTNSDLCSILSANEITHLLAFRAGLVVGGKVREQAKCLNVHCAKIPEYQGLGAISNALKNNDLAQNVTIHHMAAEIDGGQVIWEENYNLDPAGPYWRNELHAYQAGVRALEKYMTCNERLEPD